MNVYDDRGDMLVFAPRSWRPVVGVASMDRPVGPRDELQARSNAGWIHADFTRGFSIRALSGRTTVKAVTKTEVRGQFKWRMGFPNDSGRLGVVGAFRAKRGCP